MFDFGEGVNHFNFFACAGLVDLPKDQDCKIFLTKGIGLLMQEEAVKLLHLANEVDMLLSKKIVRTVNRAIDIYGKPTAVRVDNGPEFICKDFELWTKKSEILIQYIQPGKAMQNGYIELFNQLYREAVLDTYLFFDLYQVKQLTNE